MHKKIEELKSVGSGIDKKGFVYPKFINGNFDFQSGVHISNIDNEWFLALSKKDKETVESVEAK